MKTVEKLNKKASEYRLTATSNTKDYSFIIDASILNKPNFLITWYISNFKMALKKHLINNDPAISVMKASKYVNKRFKKYFNNKLPYVSIGICKKEEDKFQILLINDIKCYIKTDKVKLYENDVFSTKKTKSEYQKHFNKINDSDKYICHQFLYDETFSILLCNEGFKHYQTYLDIKDKDFFDLIANQGLRYCYNNLKRAEEKDKTKEKIPRFNQIDDIVAIYKKLL